MKTMIVTIAALATLAGCGTEIPTDPNPEIAGGWGEAEKTGPKYSIGGGPDGRVVQIPKIYKLDGRPVFTVLGGPDEWTSYYIGDGGEIVIVDTGPKLKTGGGGPTPVVDDGDEHIRVE